MKMGQTDKKIKRFVYPKIDRFWQDRGEGQYAKQLEIASETDDGSCWYGLTDAIKNYCKENGLSVDQVLWKVQVKPGQYETIEANNLKDWEEKFSALDVMFEYL